jgi:uncharacterized protein (TIGR03083 family)
MSIDYVEHIEADAAALVVATRGGPRSAPIAACPGWDLATLAGHLGAVHRWATEIVTSGQRPETFPDAPSGTGAGVGVGDYLADGVEPLVKALASLAPDAPCWNFSRGPQVGAFWPRRQALETVVHRWDGEQAVGAPRPIDAELAADGIDELFTVFVSGIARRANASLPGTVHLHCTDVAGEWMITADDGSMTVTREHGKGDVAVRGPAATLLLVAWHRLPADHGDLEHFGDRAVFDALLNIGAP